jgi:hypothetical protein
MAKLPAAGDPVLFFGRTLEVLSVEEKNGVTLVNVCEADAIARREAARDQIMALRATQANLTGTAHAAVHDQIKAIDDAASEAAFRLKIRLDLLAFWEDRGIWVSDGRILSDDQKIAAGFLGMKSEPDNQRDILVIVEPYMETDAYRARLEAIKGDASASRAQADAIAAARAQMKR